MALQRRGLSRRWPLATGLLGLCPGGSFPRWRWSPCQGARGLRLNRAPGVDALTPVAEFFARRDFTVASRTTAAGLQLRADDGPFATGTGPLVTGSTLALVMSMAGRAAYVDQLEGPGVKTLRARFHGHSG